MTTPATVKEAIEENAKGGVASTAVDGTSTQFASIKDQIDADRYLAGRTAATSQKTGLRLFTVKGNSPV